MTDWADEQASFIAFPHAVALEAKACDTLLENIAQALREAEAKGREAGLKEAEQYVTWSRNAKGDSIHPAAKAAFDDAIGTIQTANMPRASTMQTGEENSK